jgi:UDP-glucose 4-epimerase
MVETVGGKALSIRESPRRAGDPPYLVARASRIRAELGWTPRYDDLEVIVASALAFEKKLLREPWD